MTNSFHKEKIKTFPMTDMFKYLKLSRKSRTPILFFISLIAYYNEKDRSSGKELGLNIDKDYVSYKIRISDNEIQKKFNFSIDTIINIKRLLEESSVNVKIEYVDKTLYKKKYKRLYSIQGRWIAKYINYEKVYKFKFSRKGRKIIYIPTKIIYDKNLTHSEKLAILWNISLRERLCRQPKLKELEKDSGISERTIRKAKGKHPQFFKNYS